MPNGTSMPHSTACLITRQPREAARPRPLPGCGLTSRKSQRGNMLLRDGLRDIQKTARDPNRALDRTEQRFGRGTLFPERGGTIQDWALRNPAETLTLEVSVNRSKCPPPFPGWQLGWNGSLVVPPTECGGGGVAHARFMSGAGDRLHICRAHRVKQNEMSKSPRSVPV